MGLFSKYQFKQKINKNGSLVLAKYPVGGYDLIRNGRVVERNIKLISRNALNPQVNDSREVFYIETADYKYKILDIDTGEILIDGLKPRDDDFAKITHDGESIIIELNGGIWVVNKKGLTISEDYAGVSKANQHGVRKVEKLNGGLDCYYYIDDYARKISPDFALEKDAGLRYKIVRYKDQKGEYKDYIWSQEGKFISKGFDRLDYINGRFLAENKGQVYFVDQIGDRRTKNLSNYKILRDGTIVIKDDGKNTYTIYDSNYGESQILKKVVVDEKSGIIIGDDINDRTLMMGYNHDKVYVVNPVASRLIVKGVASKNIDEKLLVEAIRQDVDFDGALDIYEQIVNQNLVIEGKNRVLKQISLNARRDFLEALRIKYLEKGKILKIDSKEQESE